MCLAKKKRKKQSLCELFLPTFICKKQPSRQKFGNFKPSVLVFFDFCQFINSVYTGIMLSFDINRYVLHEKKKKKKKKEKKEEDILQGIFLTTRH